MNHSKLKRGCRIVQAAVAGLCLSVATVGAVAGPRIAVIPAEGESVPFWKSFDAGAVNTATQAGAEIAEKVPPVTMTSGVQTRMLDALIGQKIDGLIIAPVTAAGILDEGMVKQLAKLAAANVKVVVVGTPPIPGFENTSVWINPDKVAAAGADRLAEIVTARDEIGIYRTFTADGAFNTREKQVVETLSSRYPGIVLHVDIFIPDLKALPQAKLMFQKHPRTNVVFTPTAVSTRVVQQALHELHLAGNVKHVGYGTSLDAETAAAIEEGAMSAFISQDPNRFGSKAAETLLALIRGEKFPPQLDVGFTVVTKENVAALKSKIDSR
jgi:ABC-type sugar transport system substrate-binding protein